MEVYLTQLSKKYIDSYMELVNSEEVGKTTEPLEKHKMFQKEEMLNWLNSLPQKKNRRDFAILSKDNNDFIGELVLNSITDEACNIRIALLPKYFNQGLGTQAMKLGIDFAFNQLQLSQIKLSVYNINPRGIKVYEKCGFEEVSRKQVEHIQEIEMELNRYK